MSTTFAQALDEIVARKQTREASIPMSASEFYRLSATHLALNVLPELGRFEDCLKHQGVRINVTSVVEQATVRASLAIERPEDTYNLLSVIYDFGTRSLVFEAAISGMKRETRERFPISILVHITPAVVYGIIEEFIASIFNTYSLCDYEDDGTSITQSLANGISGEGAR